MSDDNNNPTTTPPTGDPVSQPPPSGAPALPPASPDDEPAAPAAQPAADPTQLNLISDLRTYGPWILLVAGPTIAWIWSFPVAVFLFLVTLCLAAFLRWGQWLLGWGKVAKVLVSIAYALALIFAPLYLEPCARKWWGEAETPWSRWQNPEKIYGACNVSKVGFTDEQKELLERWDLCDPGNSSQNDVILAAKLLSIPGDAFAPFEPMEIAPGETFTIIIVETIMKWVTVEVKPEKKTKKKDDPKKDEEEGPPPPPKTERKKVSRLRITFITPASLEVQDASVAKATISTARADAGADAGKVEELKGSIETSKAFNRYAITVTDLSESPLTIVSRGLAASLRGEGERISHDQVVDQVGKKKDKGKGKK